MGLRARLACYAILTLAVVAMGSGLLTIHAVEHVVYRVVEDASAGDIEELRGVIREQMAAGDGTAMKRLVTDIGHAPGVLWVSILDADGKIRYSSDPGSVGGRFDPSSIELKDLGGLAGAGRTQTEAIVRKGCSALRTMTALANGPTCHACHDHDQKVLGAVIIDRSLAPQLNALGTLKMNVIWGSVAAALALALVLGLSIEGLVLKRLQRIGEATRRLGAGDLGARANDAGGDELAALAADFDGMAGRLECALVEIAAERRQLEELVNGIADGVLLLDTELRVVLANRAWLARLPEGAGLPGSTYRELALAAGLEPDLARQGPAALALRSGLLEKSVVEVSGPAGERVEEIYAQALRGPHGAPVAIIEVWRDITDRKTLEASLEQSERLAAIGVLASSVAHEVGNPLASIITAVDGLLRRLDAPGSDPEEIRAYLEIVRSQVFRCRGVTERLLDFARAPSTELGVVDAAAAARTVLALLGPQATAQRVSIASELAEALPVVAADRALEQVFLNIAVNALRAMRQGGTLAVSAAGDEREVRLRFADTGPGIPDHVRRKLFQPFQRARPDGTGTGLGLFICQTLVARCRGRIEVESEPGKGSAFTVHLERARLDSVSLQERHPA